MFFYKKFSNLLSNALNTLVEERVLSYEVLQDKRYNIEFPTNPKFGDLATNVAMVTVKKSSLNLIKLAEKIREKLEINKIIKKIDIVNPGFLNIFFERKYIQNQLEIVLEGKIYKVNQKKRINIEYVSANPTGLMHIGHARGAVLGDCIANILMEAGHTITKEYYINDAGNQINVLINTILFHIKNLVNQTNKKITNDMYPGKYIFYIAKDVKKFADENNLPYNSEKIKFHAVYLILNDIKKDLEKLGVNHDQFISEKKISTEDKVKKTIQLLKDKNLAYEGYQDPPKALKNKEWEKKKQLLFKSKEINDDSDRALIKPNGELTYFMSDIIYHESKIKKNNDILINIWGIDHSGYVSRIKNAISMMFGDECEFKIKLTALVNLIKDNKSLKMSKRDGVYITLREVLNEVGKDALRFMMISRSSEKIIDFDFDLVKSKTKENPVFYVQYAHARCYSINEIAINKLGSRYHENKVNYELLTLDEEISLIKLLCSFNKIIELAVENYEPHRITNYLYELSKNFHAYWALGSIDEKNRILKEKEFDLSFARLALVDGVKKTLKKGLSILDISAPNSM